MTKIGSAKIGFAEIASAEVGLTDVGAAKIRLDVSMLFSPFIPHIYPLFEDIKVLLVCHIVHLCLKVRLLVTFNIVEIIIFHICMNMRSGETHNICWPTLMLS